MILSIDDGTIKLKFASADEANQCKRLIKKSKETGHTILYPHPAYISAKSDLCMEPQNKTYVFHVHLIDEDPTAPIQYVTATFEAQQMLDAVNMLSSRLQKPYVIDSYEVGT